MTHKIFLGDVLRIGQVFIISYVADDEVYLISFVFVHCFSTWSSTGLVTVHTRATWPSRSCRLYFGLTS